MIKKRRINDVVVVVVDNEMHTRTGVDDATWISIMETCDKLEDEFTHEENWDLERYSECESYTELLDLLIPERITKKLEEEQAKQEAIKDAQLELDFKTRLRKAKRIADISGLFEYDEDGITYMKGFKHPMPKILVEALLDANYNPKSNYTVNSLVNFWKYLLLNPDKHVRTGLFKWIDTGKFALTEGGNIISYRNVDVKKKSSSKKLQDFISESWSKIRRWKKSPKNYIVHNGGNRYFLMGIPSGDHDYTKDKSYVGNLAIMYADLGISEDVTVYTDNYTGKMEIKLGEAVSMPRSECDNDPNSQCSRGLHQKSKSYGQWLGSTSLVCVVNPYNVVAIPNGEENKFRTCEYLPVSKAEMKDGDIVEFEPGTYDIEYNGLESLTKLLETKSIPELIEAGELNGEIDCDDFGVIMEEARKVINERVVELD